ncbi:hypothetical protein [Kitasatospora sp. NPDC050463]
MYTVARLTADGLPDAVEQPAGLLVDIVEGGASPGFPAPLDPADATAW